MKRILLSLILLGSVFCCYGEDIIVGDLKFSISENSASVLGLSNESATNVIIPEQIEYDGKIYSITSIRGYAFSGCTGLTSVTIPNSVTSIREYAFSGCTGLTRVSIIDLAAWCNISFFLADSNPLLYGHHLYMNDEEITNLVIPDSVTSIGLYAFSGCSGLTSVTIPNSVTSIGSSAFSGCNGLTSVTIPNSVTSMGNYAFSGCTGLKTVYYLARRPFKIKSGCFSDETYENATLIVSKGYLPTVSTLEDWSNFQNIVEEDECIDENGIKYRIDGNKAIVIELANDSTEKIVIPQDIAYKGIPYTVVGIGNIAFAGCTGLTSVTIPNSVTSIGKSAFAGCTGLTSVTIPNSVTSMGDYAFSGCTGLTSVTIPNSVTSIRDYAFSGCTGLTSITIPNSVTYIGDGAFHGCTGLTSITIPDSVTRIGNYAFSGCSGLTSVSIGSSVTGIGNEAFSWCTSLTSITIPDSIKGIGHSAFSGCISLTSVTIPSSVTHIGERTFSGCSRLTEIVSDSPTPSGCQNNSFDNETKKNATLYVLEGSISAYRDAWGFDNIAVINQYTLKFVADGNVVSEMSVDHGSTITAPNAPAKTGYTFVSWGNVPATMPAKDVTYTAEYKVNQYKLTYMIDGVVYKTFTLDYDSVITPEGDAEDDDYYYGWEEIPDRMPDHDVTVNAYITGIAAAGMSLSNHKYEIYTIDGKKLNNLQKGVNIIRRPNGKTQKVIIR